MVRPSAVGETQRQPGAPPVHRAALAALTFCGLWAWSALLPLTTQPHAGAAADGVAPPPPTYRLHQNSAQLYLADPGPLMQAATGCQIEAEVQVGDAIAAEFGWHEGLGLGCRLIRRTLSPRLQRRLGLLLPINELNIEQLQVLDGVGPARARALAAAAPYADVADLQRARGIGPKRARALAKAVRFRALTPLLPLLPMPQSQRLGASTHQKL